MRPRKYPEFNLKYYVSKVCPECGHGSEEVVRYFKRYKSSAYKEAYDLTSEKIIDVLGILLGSDINIFTKEYKSLLNYAKVTLEPVYNTVAKSIYELYKDSFDKIN